MKPEFIVLCGLAFSGKSTIARRVAAELGAELISYDAIHAARGFDGGTVMDDSATMSGRCVSPAQPLSICGLPGREGLA
jgi:tRNA A37 N6-isopentenylltransferase MiaA